MKLLATKLQKSYENAKICYICTEKFENKYLKDGKYCKVRDHWYYTREYRGAVHIICNLKYNTLKEISKVFRNGSNYDYHFIIKHLTEEFKIQFISLVENTESDIPCTVPIEKAVT